MSVLMIIVPGPISKSPSPPKEAKNVPITIIFIMMMFLQNRANYLRYTYIYRGSSIIGISIIVNSQYRDLYNIPSIVVIPQL